MQRTACLAFSLLTLVTLSAAQARADTITVSGTAVVRRSEPGSGSGIPSSVTLSASLTGLNFSAGVSGSNGFFGIANCGNFANRPCLSGNLDSSIGGSDLFGAFSINGVTYGAATSFNGVSLSFRSVTFIIPAGFADAPGVVVTAPFTFSGGATGQFPIGGGEVFNSVSLTGEGTATLLLVRGSFTNEFGRQTGLLLDSLTYTFGTPPSQVSITAVPEPATLVLLGTGLAGAVGAARRRSKAAAGEDS